MSFGLGLLPLLAIDCSDPEPEYEQLNGSDTLSIEVGVAEALDLVETELSSNTGTLVVGTASADPGGGPAGTTHTVVVVVEDDFANQVDRVRVSTKSDGRANETFDLAQDAFDEAVWAVEIISFAEGDEVRTDTLSIELLDEVGDTDPSVPGSGDTAE